MPLELPPRLPRPNPRRRTLLGAGGLAGLGLLTGCGAGRVGSGPRVTFWHLLSGGDGVRMEEILAAVGQQNPDVRIDPTCLAWGAPYYTKLAMASAGGRAPDLAVMHLSRLPGYAPGGLIDPWDLERFAKYDVDEDTFTAATFSRMTVDGQLFAIALDSHAFVRFFNPDVAEEAGQLDTDGKLLPTATVEEFIAQAVELQAATGELGLSYGWLGDNGNMWRLFWTFYSQLGATMELVDGRFVFDEQAFVTALDTVIAIIDSPAANRRSDGGFAFSTFTSGQSGEIFSGVWDLPGLLESEVPLDASPIPNLFGTGIDAVWGDSHAFVLPHQDDPDEEARENTYETVSLILKDSFTWAQAGHTPAYQPVVETPEFGELEPNANYAQTADFLVYDPALPFAGSGSTWQVQFGQSVQSALLGDASSEQALQAFTRVTEKFVRTAANT